MKKIWRSCTALLMALCLMLGVCSTGLAAGLADYGVTEEQLLEMIKDGTIKIEEIDLEKVEELIDSGAVEVPADKKDDLLGLIEDLNNGEKTLEEVVEEVQKQEITVEIKDQNAVMDAVQNGGVKVETTITPEQMIQDMIASGKLDAAIQYYIDYAMDLAGQVKEILKALDPTVKELGNKLEVLNGQLAEKVEQLDKDLAPHVAAQEKALADLVAQHAALVEELEALNAKLEAVKNGSYGRSATTASAKDQMIAELEADIAETEAQIAELEEAIAFVTEQLKTDKSGIETIKAAIADIKANILATEAALAEVNAAIDQLVADLAELNEALEVLVEAADHLAGLTVGEVDVDAVVEAVITIAENIPAVLEALEYTYNKVVETIEKAEVAVEEIKATAAIIEVIVKEMNDAADEIVDIAGEEAAIIKQAVEEMAALVEEFVQTNLPVVEEALKPVVADLEALVLAEVAKAEAWWIKNEATVYAAVTMGYMYCVQQGYVDQAKALIEKYTTITDEDIEAIKGHLANAEAIVLEQLEAAEAWLLNELAELEEKLVGAEGALKAKIEAKIAEVEAKIAEVKAVIVAVKAYFAEVKAAVEAVDAALADVVAAAKKVGTDVKALCEAVKNLKAAICRLNESVVVLHDAVVNEVAKLLGYCGLIAGEAIDVVESLGNYVDLLSYIPAIIEEAYIDAITDNYLVSIDSHYVALGDANAYGDAADMLAEELTKFLGAEVGFDNLTRRGQSAAELLKALSGYAASIEKADLVTVGFSANTFTQFVVDQVKIAAGGGTPAEMAWDEFLGEDGAAYVNEAMNALYAEIAAAGAADVKGIDAAALVCLAVESYAYAYVEYVVNYIQVVEGIHAINPDAQVVLVGMHNPMAGVVLNVEGTEIALGDYLNYIVEVSNVYSLGYAFVASQTIFVDAPAVETANEAGVQEVLFFVMNLMMNGTESYVPTEAGHTYIQEQIWNALNVYKVGMLGDVDSDGDVDYVDAMLTLQYYTEEIGAEDLDVTVADVDGNGVINYVDAMLILQHYTHEIAVFPAA